VSGAAQAGQEAPSSAAPHAAQKRPEAAAPQRGQVAGAGGDDIARKVIEEQMANRKTVNRNLASGTAVRASDYAVIIAP